MHRRASPGSPTSVCLLCAWQEASRTVGPDKVVHRATREEGQNRASAAGGRDPHACRRSAIIGPSFGGAFGRDHQVTYRVQRRSWRIVNDGHKMDAKDGWKRTADTDSGKRHCPNSRPRKPLITAALVRCGDFIAPRSFCRTQQRACRTAEKQANFFSQSKSILLPGLRAIFLPHAVSLKRDGTTEM